MRYELAARSNPIGGRRWVNWRLGLLGLVVTGVTGFALIPSGTAADAADPTGLTALALPGRVELAWQAAGDGGRFDVVRRSEAGRETTVAQGLRGTSFTDSTALNGHRYSYAVRLSGTTLGGSNLVLAEPLRALCAGRTQISRENCIPGDNGWRMHRPLAAAAGGIEGFATATSINAGEAVDVKVNTSSGARFRIEIYRTGYYGGAQGRLVSVLTGLRGTAQPACQRNVHAGDGLIDCSNWAVSATLTTTRNWPTGIYLLRVVRESNGTENQILLVVRHDGSRAQIVYGLPVATYEAYNNYGGRSLYTFNSGGSPSVAGTPRAVKVSFDRPYAQSVDRSNNWYAASDIQNVSFLEHHGYEISYVTSVDLDRDTAILRRQKVFVSPSHDEYWSAGMRKLVTAARNRGTSLLYLGSNADYWKIRFESSPYSGASHRVEVCYKTSEGGPADPTGVLTTTWRDPAVGLPENSLLGEQYAGSSGEAKLELPLVVTAAQGRNRVWRGTPLADLPSGSSARVGHALVGWEWDAPAHNGAQPAKLILVSSSPVPAGASDLGKARNPTRLASATVYRAASGAWVFDTGTNNWSRGLGRNMTGDGEPNPIIERATLNILADMGAPAPS
jgi:hypothetical protein